MEKGNCMLCSAEDRRIFDIVNTDLQEVFEKITGVKIQDNPYFVCFICRKRIQKCQQLWHFAKQTYNVRKALMENKKSKKLQKEMKSFRPLIVLSKAMVGNVSIPPKGIIVPVKDEVEIKEEPIDLDYGEFSIAE